MKAIGIMSGTSLDGVDVVLCEVAGVDLDTKIEELAFETFPFNNSLDKRLQKIISEKHASLEKICSINFELGEFFADCCLRICSKAGIDSTELDFIASHGQTIYHISEKTDNLYKSTLQLGEAAVIAAKCGCKVISNFRTKDIAVGGQGAPLVPFSEAILFSNPNKNIGLQNIGGIGNITVLPKNCNLDQVIAFDTGPGNMMINATMKYFFNEDFDRNGITASKGNIDELLKTELVNHDYLQARPPKSTGRELFGDDYTYNLIKKYSQTKPEDFVTTLTWYTAYCIYKSYHEFILPKTKLDQLIVGGGGAHNQALLKFVSELLPEVEVMKQEDLGKSSDSKEAVAFVILGNQTMHCKPSNLPSVTGAKENVILGQITYPN